MELAEIAWLIPAFSFVAFLLIALFGKLLPGKGAFLAVLAIAGGFVTFWVVLVGFFDAGCSKAFGVETCHFSREWFTAGDVELSWGMIIDPLALLMLGMVTFVGLMIQVYSLGYMKGDSRFGWYFAVHALFIASMLTLVLADNFLLLYVVWELVGICSYLLIGFWYERRSAAEAAKKAFITTRIGDVGLLVGILLLGKEVGDLNGVTFDFDMGHAFEAASSGAIGEGTLSSVAVLLFLGAMGKSAQFPLHVWLPDAMEGPTPVSALIHAATMVAAGVYLVARAFPIFEATPDVLIAVAVIGLITALIGATMALVVTDLKRILAYSTISHLGLMMLSLGAFGYTAAIFHLMAHGFSKALLFLGAGSIMHGMNEEMDIRKMGGLWRVMPITAITFTIGALSLAGIPMFAGFWSKDEMLLSVLDNKNYLLAFALIAAFLSALYMARATFVVFFGELKAENRHVHESPWLITAPMVVLAVLAVTFGFVSMRMTDGGGFGTFLFFEHLHDFDVNPGIMAGSIILALGAVAISWGMCLGPQMAPERWKVRYAAAMGAVVGVPSQAWKARFAAVAATSVRVVSNKYYLDEAYQWAVDRVVLVFSRFVALFDRVVVNDTAVNRTGESVRRLGLGLRYHVTGRVYTYALGMVVGVVFTTILWWALTTRG